MRIRTIVNAQSAEDGSVVNRIDEVVADTATLPNGSWNVYGFDSLPKLPISPDEIKDTWVSQGVFPEVGGVRCNLIVLQPLDAPVNMDDAMGEMVLGADIGLQVHESGGGMHRTDSVDILVVIEGEVDIEAVNDDGMVSLTAGDLFIQNGCFHRWVNRSSKPCTVMAILFATDREG